MDRKRAEIITLQFARTNFSDGRGYDLRTAIETLINDRAGEWVSCEERLPQIDVPDNGDNGHSFEYYASARVLLMLKNDAQRIGFFVSALRNKVDSNHEQWVEVDECGSLALEEVTHWMPLPRKPNEE